MSKPVLLAAGLAAAIGATAFAQDAAPQAARPDPAAAVAARQAQMAAMQLLAFHIDHETEGADENTLFRLNEEGMALAAMLQAVPLLFAPGTAPTDLPEDTVVQSQADPAIWENWEEFEALASDARAAAQAVEAAQDEESMLTAITELNAACSACHDRFLAYESPF